MPFLSNFYFRVGGTALSRRMMNRFRNNVQILMYHRILPAKSIEPKDTGWTVSQEMFSEQMKFISENYNVIPISDLRKNATDPGKKSVVVTFDDGYRDNLEIALPILKKYSVSATIYVTTDFVSGKADIWWYKVFEICESENSLEFFWKGNKFLFDLSDPDKKKKARDKLRSLILSLGKSERSEFLKIFIEKGFHHEYSGICLDRNGLKELSREPLITIGAHTQTHCPLSKLTADEAKSEMLNSKKILEEITGKTVDHFAYPYGTKNEAGKREYKLAEETGFKTAVTTLNRPWKKPLNYFDLPRIGMSEADDKNRLDVKLSGWNTFLRR